MGLFTVCISDDRGRSVPMLDMSGWSDHIKFGLTTTEFRQMCRSAKPERKWFFPGAVKEAAPLTGAFVLLIVGLFGMRLISSSLPPIRGRTWGGVVVFLLMLVIVFVAMRWTAVIMLSNRSKRLRSVLIQAQRCASCAYILGGLDIEDDGCTVCPECGAAWRLKEAGA